MASLRRGRVLVFLPAFVEACRALHHCRRDTRDAICQRSTSPSRSSVGTVHFNRLLFLSLIEELVVLLLRLLVCIDTGAISQFPVADVPAPSRLMFAVHPLHLSFNWFTPEPINQLCLETVPLSESAFPTGFAATPRCYPSASVDRRNEVRPQQKFRFTATFREKC